MGVWHGVKVYIVAPKEKLSEGDGVGGVEGLQEVMSCRVERPSAAAKSLVLVL